MMDALAIKAAEAAVHPNFPPADTMLIVELDGPAAEVRELFAMVESICRRTGATHGRSGRRRGAPAAHLEGAQGGVCGDGPRVAELLRAGRRGAADEAARGARPHPRAVGAQRPRHRQRLPRRRRQPAPAHLLRRARAGPGRAGRARRRRDPDLLRRGGRLDHRRARRGRGQEGLHAAHVLATTTSTRCSRCATPSIRSACAIPARCCRRRGCAARCPGRIAQHPVERAGLAERF